LSIVDIDATDIVARGRLRGEGGATAALRSQQNAA